MASATRPLRNLTTISLHGLRNLRRAPFREFRSSSPLRRLSIFDIPARATTRRHIRTDVLNRLLLTKAVHRDVSPSVVALLSYFSGPESQEVPHSAVRGTGFFVAPTLIVTSARVVGRVSTFYDSDRSSVLHNSFIARTVAFNGYQEVFRTRPAAVNFAVDVAVLEVLNPRPTAPPLAVAKSVADKDSILLGIARHASCTALTFRVPVFGVARKKSGRSKAPWPLDNELEWVDYGASQNIEQDIDSMPQICGSPWFNVGKEVVGFSSWAEDASAKGEEGINSYSVPPSSIRLMVDYATTKAPDDPIVVDRWINAHTIPDYNDSDITEECVPLWPTSTTTQFYAL